MAVSTSDATYSRRPLAQGERPPQFGPDGLPSKREDHGSLVMISGYCIWGWRRKEEHGVSTELARGGRMCYTERHMREGRTADARRRSRKPAHLIVLPGGPMVKKTGQATPNELLRRARQER